MRLIHLSFITIFVFLAIGCGGGSNSHNDTIVIIEDDPNPVDLEAFHLVDSYGINSEDLPGSDLFLNPYQYYGEFEVYWYAFNEGDYTTEVRINDRPSLEGSRLISPDYCGPGLECDNYGIQYCNYYSDFSISCDPPSTEEPGKYITYFDDWVVTLPKKLYLILKVCDVELPYCESSIKEVFVE